MTRERICRFGDAQGLVGILTEPAAGPGEGPAFLILNAGLVHRVGPNRLHVRLARRLAAAGLPALRFDLSGLGDSAPRTDGLPYHASRVEEARAAMDYLERERRIRSFVALGLCSGADHAFRTAWHDERVIGAAMIDGYAYASRASVARQRRQRLREAGTRLLRAETWRRIVTGRHPMWQQLVARLRGSADENAAVERFVIDLPPRAEAAEQTQRLAARGVRLLFVYTGRLSKMHLEAEGSTEAFPPRDPAGRVQVACLTGSDHTLTLLSDQERLFSAVLDWAHEVWPAGVVSSA